MIVNLCKVGRRVRAAPTARRTRIVYVARRTRQAHVAKRSPPSAPRQAHSTTCAPRQAHLSKRTLPLPTRQAHPATHTAQLALRPAHPTRRTRQLYPTKRRSLTLPPSPFTPLPSTDPLPDPSSAAPGEAKLGQTSLVGQVWAARARLPKPCRTWERGGGEGEEMGNVFAPIPQSLFCSV